jgi:hypothetical protein
MKNKTVFKGEKIAKPYFSYLHFFPFWEQLSLGYVYSFEISKSFQIFCMDNMTKSKNFVLSAGTFCKVLTRKPNLKGKTVQI